MRWLRILPFPALLCAQGVDSLVLSSNPMLGVAADSKGNAVVIQQTIVSFCGSACVVPPLHPVWAVFRYDLQGALLTSYTKPDQVFDAEIAIHVFGVDSKDNIYLGGFSSTAGVILLRITDLPPAWAPAINGSQLNLLALAFDPQDNPVLLAFDGAYRIVKLDRTSGAIIGDYHVGGPVYETAALTVDAAGNVYVATQDDQTGKALVVKLDATLRAEVYRTLVGGNAIVFPAALAAAPDGSLYIAGSILGGDFPITPGAFQKAAPLKKTVPAGSVFVTHVSADGGTILASTFLAGSYSEGVSGLRLEPDGNIVVSGATASPDFPATGVWTTACGPNRGAFNGLFVSTLDSSLSHLVSSALVPQRSLRGSSPLLADGTLYLTTLDAASRLLHASPETPSSPVACVVNGASFLAEDAVAPGQLLTIFGEGLGPNGLLTFDSSQQLPVSADGTEVHIGGIPAPLLAATHNQINAIVPSEATGQVPVEVYRNDRIIYTWRLSVVPENPTALLRFKADGTLDLYQFWINSPSLPLADAWNADGTPNSAANPAHWGSIVSIFATGFGQLTPPVQDGAAGGAPPSLFNGAVFSVANGQAPVSGSYSVVGVTTVAGRTNSVVQVNVQLPAPFASATAIPIPVEFRLGPPVGSQDWPANVIYVSR